jgi:signal transduction histidine kinase
MAFLSSLTNRIFLATATLAVLAIGFAVYLISARAVNEAEAELQRGVVEAGALVEQHRATLVDTLAIEAWLIADLPRLKAAVATGDPPTIAPVAADYQARVRSDLFVVTDHGGRVLAASGVPASPGAPLDLPGVDRALAGEESRAFWSLPDGLAHAVTVPIAIGLDSPELLGSLSVGLRFDDALAARFERLTDSRVVFAVHGDVQGPLAETGEARTALAGALASTGVTRVTLGGVEYVAHVQPLSPAGAAEARRADPGRSAAPFAIVLRSRSDRLRFLDELFVTLGGATLLAVLLAIGLSYGVARTVTRPLAAITAAMREMTATGDLTRKIALPHQGRWQDEDASLLAATFNTLTDSIARFERDAAHRERLSSLGRLSTVVAHEIRNPLMIIKASLRTLRRDDAAPGAVREAAADIDEEVARLNRVVNDVLDFARPPRFALAPVDLNALCHECAAAVAAGDRAATVRVTADPSLAPVVTDGDRLRTALVNVLVNAQEAVSARTDRAVTGALPAVELRTARRNGTVAIVVTDRGGGIAAEDLARVFEPYFTTRRTGTGLGLPIARNIVEGLGGTIAVQTRPGDGTEMRIELPDRPAVS